MRTKETRPKGTDPRHWDAVAARDEAMATDCRTSTRGTDRRRKGAAESWAAEARKHRRWAMEARSEGCQHRVEPSTPRRPVNGLNIEIGSPHPRCMLKCPDGRGAAWLFSGGSILSYGYCALQCPRLPVAEVDR